MRSRSLLIRAASAVARPRLTRAALSVRLAFWAFVGVELVAFVLWLSLGRTEWFHGDDWQFLAGRTAFSAHDLLTDHNTHWSTIPLLVFRLLWWMFGLRSYAPYIAVVIALHLTAAALLRVVMRRANVNAWIATAAASTFAFFGAGYQNIVWAFQVGFVGSLVLGLAQLLLADHDGPIGRRDWLGLAAGLASLMSAGVGVALVGATTLTVLIRRGWQVALFYGGILGGVYGLWWATIAAKTDHPGVRTQDVGVGDVIAFVREGLQHAFGSLGQNPIVGFVLGALLVVGIPLAYANRGVSAFRHAAAPVSLGFAAIAFLMFSGYGRVGVLGTDVATSSRYQHVIVALLLPALAVALDGFSRLWRPLTPILCCVLVLGIPGNVEVLADYTRARERMHRDYRRFIGSIPRTEYASQVPPTVRPDTHHGDHAEITVGWLLAGANSGRIPNPGHVTPDKAATIRFHLSLLQQSDEPLVRSDCQVITGPIEWQFEEGESIAFESDGILSVTPVPGAVSPAVAMGFRSENGSRLVAVLGPLEVILRPVNPFLPMSVCDVKE